MGGVPLFFRKETVIITITTVIFTSLGLYNPALAGATVTYGLLLIIISLVFGKKKASIKLEFLLTVFAGIILSLYMINAPRHLIHFLPSYLYGIISSPRAIFSCTLIVIFLWLLFNAVLLIIQFAEFFSSTAGLYALLGSDESRVFLTPLPQLLLVTILTIGLYEIWIQEINNGIYITALALVLTFSLVSTKKYGRIVRSAIGFFIFYASYITLGFYFSTSVQQNIIVWVIITVLSVLFIAQNRAIKFIATRAAEPDASIYGLLGMVMIIIYYIASFSNGQEAITLWWLLSLFAVTIAPLIFLSYSLITNRMKYYVERNKISTIQLFSEMSLILGKVVLTEFSKIITRKILEQITSKKFEKS